MTVNPHRRLQSETYSIDLPLGDRPYPIEVSIARDENDTVREVVFVGRGKTGTNIHELLCSLGIGLSRALQRRSPMTGEPVEASSSESPHQEAAGLAVSEDSPQLQ